MTNTQAALPEHLQARVDRSEPQVSGPTGGGQALIAFALALSAVEPVAKTQTADTGKYKYSYADLGAVIDECKRACELHGLALTQNPSMSDSGHLTVGTTIIHALKMPNDAQALGSALTYMRRYSLMSIFGIAPEDDDGAAATRSVRQEDQHPGYRSGAEERIRNLLGELDPEARAVVQRAFKIAFGMGLADLPVAKHGDALQFTIDSVANLAALREAEAAQAAAESSQAEGDTPAGVASGAGGAGETAPSAPPAPPPPPPEVPHKVP
jgi:ERF superfamily